MLDWLVDEPTNAYLVLGTVALLCGAVWWETRQGRILLGVGAAIVLALVVWLLSVLIVTDRRRLIDSIQQMSAAVAQRDTDGIFRHISRDFQLGNLGQQPFRQFVAEVLRNGEVTSVEAWDFVRPAEITRSPDGKQGTARITFMAKPKGPQVQDNVGYRVRATFVLEADGKWRMTTFTIHNPVNDAEMDIPRLPN
jgi:hypothetical protein